MADQMLFRNFTKTIVLCGRVLFKLTEKCYFSVSASKSPAYYIIILVSAQSITAACSLGVTGTLPARFLTASPSFLTDPPRSFADSENTVINAELPGISPDTKEASPPVKTGEVVPEMEDVYQRFQTITDSTANPEDALASSTIPTMEFENVNIVLDNLIPAGLVNTLTLEHTTGGKLASSHSLSPITTSKWVYNKGHQDCINRNQIETSCSYYEISTLKGASDGPLIRLFTVTSVSFGLRTLGSDANPLEGLEFEDQLVALTYPFPYGITGVIRKYHIPSGGSRDSAFDRVFVAGAKTALIRDEINTLDIDRMAPRNLDFRYIGASGVPTSGGPLGEPSGFISGFGTNAGLSTLPFHKGTQATFKVDLDLDFSKQNGLSEPLALTINDFRLRLPDWKLPTSSVIGYYELSTYAAPDDSHYDIDLDSPITGITSLGRDGYDFSFAFNNNNITGMPTTVTGEIHARFYGPYFNGIGGLFFVKETDSNGESFYFWGGLGLARVGGFRK